MKLIYLALILFSSLGLLASHAFAQTTNVLPIQTLSISPIIQDLTLKSGEVSSYNIKIANNADTPIGIHINISPLPISDLPDYTIYNKKSSLTFLSWVRLSQHDILISEHSEKNITVTVSIPKSQKNSGYYAAIEYVPFFSQQEKINEPIVLTHVIGLLFATVGKLDYANLLQKTHILSFNPTSWIFETQKVSLQFVVGNEYFTHFPAKPFLTLTPIFGKPIKILLEEKHILPSSARIWLETIPLKQYSPIYFAHLVVSIGNGNQLVKDTFFILLPYHMLVSICIAILIVLLALLRKRLAKALKILIQKES